MGSFARLAQVSYLLGQVYRHLSDREVLENEFCLREKEQLEKTLRALINAAEVEEEGSREIAVCGETAICYRYSSLVSYVP
jgi:hypothetical protein